MLERMSGELPLRSVPGVCVRRPGSKDTKCQCSQECKNIAYRARKERRRRKALGGAVTRVSREDCARHLQTIINLKPDTTRTDLAEAAGVSERTIRAILTGSGPATVRASTAGRVLALRAEDIHPRGVDRTPMPLTDCRNWVRIMNQERGWSMAQIAEATGLAPGTLSFSYKKGACDTVAADVGERIWRAYFYTLREPQGKMPQTKRVPHARAQIDALRVNGWDIETIAREAGIGKSTIHHIYSGRPKTTRVLNDIEDAYERLKKTKNENGRMTATKAKRQGLAPWYAWPAGRVGHEGYTPNPALIPDPTWRQRVMERYGVTDGKKDKDCA